MKAEFLISEMMFYIERDITKNFNFGLIIENF